MKKLALIYGAGAIGRGFIAPILHSFGVRIIFVDSDGALVRLMWRQDGSYSTAFSDGQSYKLQRVEFAVVPHGGDLEIIRQADFLVSCVGRNSCEALIDRFRLARKVFICENDNAAQDLRTLLRQEVGDGIVTMCIPDVIASNSAPRSFVAKYPLAVVCEYGQLFAEHSDLALPGATHMADAAFGQRWMCKLFLHNAPHAAVAYLGAARGHEYIHEAMQDGDVRERVTALGQQLVEALHTQGMVSWTVGSRYFSREMDRFGDVLLHDSIERVARNPQLKLGADERLMKSYELIKGAGLDTGHILVAIGAAWKYHVERYP